MFHYGHQLFGAVQVGAVAGNEVDESCGKPGQICRSFCVPFVVVLSSSLVALRLLLVVLCLFLVLFCLFGTILCFSLA